MAKLKNRTKRKAVKAKQQNQAKQQRRDDGDFIKEFDGYMQISFKEETSDAAIKAGVIRRDDWLTSAYQIFKHHRYYLVEVVMKKFDPSFDDAELAWVTKDKLYRSDIVEIARQMAEEMSEGHDDIDYDNSYIRIFA